MKYRIIDFHTHLCPQLLSEMERAEVEKAVVMLTPEKLYSEKGEIVYTNPTELKEKNEELCEMAKSSNKLIPFAWLNNKVQNAENLLEELVQNGFKGLKLHPVLDNYNLGEAYELIEKASELGIPVMVHSGWHPLGKVEHVSVLAKLFPKTKFIIAHMKEEFGVNPRFSHIREAEKHENIYLECSYVPHPRRLEDAVKILGSERILFGSDFPLGGGRIDWDLTKVTYANIKEQDKINILYENAAKLLGLK